MNRNYGINADNSLYLFFWIIKWNDGNNFAWLKCQFIYVFTNILVSSLHLSIHPVCNLNIIYKWAFLFTTPVMTEK